MAKETNVSSTVIDLLQEAVNRETSTRNLYWARSIHWRSRGVERLAAYYLEQSGEDHAQRSADRMARLGRQPEVSPEPIPAVGGTLREQFEEDVAAEDGLAEMYRGAIGVAVGEMDYVTEDIWRSVLASTEGHSEWLARQIAQIDLVGEDLYLSSVWMDRTGGPGK